MAVINLVIDPNRPNITTWGFETTWEDHNPNLNHAEFFNTVMGGGRDCNPFIAKNAMAFGVGRDVINTDKLVQSITGLNIPNAEWNKGHTNGNGRLVLLDGLTRFDWVNSYQGGEASTQYNDAEQLYARMMRNGTLDERNVRAIQIERETARLQSNCFGSWLAELYDLGQSFFLPYSFCAI